jgi:hypothetical protein
MAELLQLILTGKQRPTASSKLVASQELDGLGYSRGPASVTQLTVKSGVGFESRCIQNSINVLSSLKTTNAFSPVFDRSGKLLLTALLRFAHAMKVASTPWLHKTLKYSQSFSDPALIFQLARSIRGPDVSRSCDNSNPPA